MQNKELFQINKKRTNVLVDKKLGLNKRLGNMKRAHTSNEGNTK